MNNNPENIPIALKSNNNVCDFIFPIYLLSSSSSYYTSSEVLLLLLTSILFILLVFTITVLFWFVEYYCIDFKN